MESIKDTIKKSGGMERYIGFDDANVTLTPNDLFDKFLATLNHGELKVVLYIIRRTKGFHKRQDSISLRQLTNGITKKSGEVLDKGAGVNRRTAIRAVQGLEKKGLIEVKRVKSEDGYNQVNVYSLRFKKTGE